MKNSDIYEVEEVKESIQDKIKGVFEKSDNLPEERQITFLLLLYKELKNVKKKVRKEVYELNKKD